MYARACGLVRNADVYSEPECDGLEPQQHLEMQHPLAMQLANGRWKWRPRVFLAGGLWDKVKSQVLRSYSEHYTRQLTGASAQLRSDEVSDSDELPGTVNPNVDQVLKFGSRMCTLTTVGCARQIEWDNAAGLPLDVRSHLMAVSGQVYLLATAKPCVCLHTSDGRLLVAGGRVQDTGSHVGVEAHRSEIAGAQLRVATAAIFDFRHRVWIPAGEMTVARAKFCAGLLPNGHIIAVGGEEKPSQRWGESAQLPPWCSSDEDGVFEDSQIPHEEKMPWTVGHRDPDSGWGIRPGSGTLHYDWVPVDVVQDRPVPFDVPSITAEVFCPSSNIWSRITPPEWGIEYNTPYKNLCTGFAGCVAGDGCFTISGGWSMAPPTHQFGEGVEEEN